jgi:predicted MFS family arabinose efflux permease
LIIVRVLLGFADGAFTPASISATIEASSPEHIGRNTGIQQMMLTLCGLGISPLIVAALLPVMSWRWVFAVFVIPALLVAWLTHRICPGAPAGAHIEKKGFFTDLKFVLSYPNIWIAMIDMLCWIACLITTSAFMPSYLLEYLLLNEEQMETVMSAIGFGATAGTLILSWLSDRLGRKPVLLISAAGACSMLGVLKHSVASTLPLFVSLFMVHFFNNAALALTVGPIVAETAPPAMIASASGIVVAVGELLGGGLAPMFVGQFVDRFGIVHLLWLPIASTLLGFLVSLFLEEKHGLTASCCEQDGSSTDEGDEDSSTEDSASTEEDKPPKV